MKRVMVGTVLALALVAGCMEPAPINPGEAPPELETIPGSVWLRWRDPELRVVCWLKRQSYGDAIACLPESQAAPR